jgi:hypothetical protein
VTWITALWRSIWAAILLPARWLVAHWPRRKLKLFRSERVDEFPDTLQRAKVYLAGEGDHLWAAAMICPCGCDEVIEMNLLKQVRPCWSVQEHQDGLVTLKPSVWRGKGCKSHFVLRHGRIDWC